MKLTPFLMTIALMFGIGSATVHASHGDDRSAVEATAVGVVNSIDLEGNKINISHEPISALGWPAMKMAFKVSKDIDLNHVKAMQTVDFKIAKGLDGTYVITDLSHRH